jgi:hypothetical protein
MVAKTTIGFHSYKDATVIHGAKVMYQQDVFKYTFKNFFHPFVGELIQQLNKESLQGLLNPEFHVKLKEENNSAPTDFFKSFGYTKPENSSQVEVEGFPKEIDVSESGPYANYNWELLFHIPLTVAVHLSKNQRFAEAQRWFHYVFDPTCNDNIKDPLKRFWKFIAFREKDITQIDELLALLSKKESDCNEIERDNRSKIIAGYTAIMEKPFQPHRVARTRHLAYQYYVVMKYLDNLIAWGDSLFLQDTIESINEATQRYVLAANILGARPQRIPPRRTSRPRTFNELRNRDLDPMGNLLDELEGKFPFNVSLPQVSANPDSGSPLFSIGRTLYFCIPRNDKLLAYWDTVADRLFKIRHCMNIEGIVRQLALFDPPLDPGMLVKAAAAGIDIGSIVSGLNQPFSPVRSVFFIQKSLELCSEVRGLGGALLSAIEKGDSEHMALLRQGHEIKIQELQQEVRFLQWKQSQESTESLLRSRAIALERYAYYLRLLGLTVDDNAVPKTFPLDRRELTEENFDKTYAALIGQYEKAIPLQTYPKLNLASNTSPEGQSGASGQGNLYLSTNEDAELNQHGPNARNFRLASMSLDTIAGQLALIPDVGVNFHWWGLGGHMVVFGGSLLANQMRFGSSLLNILATNEEGQSINASKTASYERRADEWMLQSNLAARELMHIGRQIIGSVIAEQIAHHEYMNIKKQIEHSREVDRFLKDKFTNQELYAWMQGEISRLYYEYYRFAFNTARKAEQTMKRELMRPEVDATDYIKFNYWDGGRKGLLSGEALYLDIKRMEMAYHENNKREYELTKHVSLRQLDPLALLFLRATGTCEVSLPEWLFNLDGPGHYMRRIKNVSLSIPSVTGPYTSVSCTLSLLRSSIRKSPLLKDDVYWRDSQEDDRFADYFGTIQSIVTSSANNDSGLFETNLRDERFLPFEGAGAISTWKLELPASFRQFDYNTISDVILHVRYTAREGGKLLGDKAIAELREKLSEAKEMVSKSKEVGFALLFSLPHDFPSEWATFIREKGKMPFTAKLRKSHFPYLVQSETLAIIAVELYSAVGSKLGLKVDLDKLNESINGSNNYYDLSIPQEVLKPGTSDAFLVVRYSI